MKPPAQQGDLHNNIIFRFTIIKKQNINSLWEGYCALATEATGAAGPDSATPIRGGLHHHNKPNSNVQSSTRATHLRPDGATPVVDKAGGAAASGPAVTAVTEAGLTDDVARTLSVPVSATASFLERKKIS